MPPKLQQVGRPPAPVKRAAAEASSADGKKVRTDAVARKALLDKFRDGFKDPVEGVLSMFPEGYQIVDLSREAAPADSKEERPDFAIELGGTHNLTFDMNNLDPTNTAYLERLKSGMCAKLSSVTITTTKIFIKVWRHDKKEEYSIRILKDSLSGIGGLLGLGRIHIREINIPDTKTVKLVFGTLKPFSQEITETVGFSSDDKEDENLLMNFQKIIKWTKK